MSFCFRRFLRKNQVRWVSTKIKIVPEFNTDIHENIASDQMNPKKHPGVMKVLPPEVPKDLLDAIKFVIKDKPVKTLIKDGEAFTRFLEGRHPPIDDEAKRECINRVNKIAANKCGYDVESIADIDDKRDKMAINNKITELYRKFTYNWKPMRYDDYLSMIYLVTRFSPEYAVLYRIFNEISVRDKCFQPKSLFDFGSGVGTVSWAAKRFWKDSLKEFFCVDISSHMNDISQALIQDGEMRSEPPKGVYFRQFLPSQSASYDIVVTAYTLFELPSKQARFETMLKLWDKTKNYLVIVERGTNSGFELVNEVRDFILFSDKSRTTESVTKSHVFAPCPHNMSCPRLEENQNSKKQTPCNFEVNYHRLSLDDRIAIGKERFCYVILKKGSRDEMSQWPRIVRSVLKRSGHCVCRFCSNDGKLQEVVFSAAKHGKIPYRCARSSHWGDLLPVKLNEKEVVVDIRSKTGSDNCSEDIIQNISKER